MLSVSRAKAAARVAHTSQLSFYSVVAFAVCDALPAPRCCVGLFQLTTIGCPWAAQLIGAHTASVSSGSYLGVMVVACSAGVVLQYPGDAAQARYEGVLSRLDVSAAPGCAWSSAQSPQGVIHLVVTRCGTPGPFESQSGQSTNMCVCVIGLCWWLHTVPGQSWRCWYGELGCWCVTTPCGLV
jgi:hypothetical protein